MGMRELEAAILSELRMQTGNRRIRQKDIMEWSTSPVAARDGELTAFLKLNQVHVAYKLPPQKARAASSLPDTSRDQ